MTHISLRRSRVDSRGVTLVEVLFVVAIMAFISSSTALLVIPEYKKARVKSVIISASAIKMAAQTYIELDMKGSDTCPTLDELVDAKKIDGKKINDPWGVPYRILCAGSEINVISSGNDRKRDTEDDIWDDFMPADVERVSKL